MFDTYSSVANVGTSSGNWCRFCREQSTIVPSQTQFVGHLLSTKHWLVYLVRNSSVPLQRNLSGLICEIRFRLLRFGSSQRTSEVSSDGLSCRYTASQRRLQSQIKGLRPRCLTTKIKLKKQTNLAKKNKRKAKLTKFVY